jgi:hypothetical protein
MKAPPIVAKRKTGRPAALSDVDVEQRSTPLSVVGGTHADTDNEQKQTTARDLAARNDDDNVSEDDEQRQRDEDDADTKRDEDDAESKRKRDRVDMKAVDVDLVNPRMPVTGDERQNRAVRFQETERTAPKRTERERERHRRLRRESH